MLYKCRHPYFDFRIGWDPLFYEDMEVVYLPFSKVFHYYFLATKTIQPLKVFKCLTLKIIYQDDFYKNQHSILYIYKYKVLINLLNFKDWSPDVFLHNGLSDHFKQTKVRKY